MTQKGVNTVITDIRKDIAEAINNGLKQGLPVSVVTMIVENALMELNNALNITLENENKTYQEQLKVQEEQVEWVDNPEVTE